MTASKADLILHNGKIITVDHEFSIKQAVAVKDGRIIATGTNENILDYKGDSTEVLDLDGKTLMPGIIDSHLHMLWTGRALREINCRTPPMKSIEDIKQAIAERVKISKPGEWITGVGWDQVKLEEHRFLTRYDLDEVSPDNPVFLQRTCTHLAVVNSKALEIAGISKDIENPPGGNIVRDDNGVPDGNLEEYPALALVQRYFPEEDEESINESLRKASQSFNRVGITSITEPGLKPDEMKAYENALKKNKLSVRINTMLWGHVEGEPFEASIRQAQEFQIPENHEDDLIRFFSLKLFTDGGFGGKTAYVREPYENDPENYGLLTIEPDELQELVDIANVRGMGLCVHCCGGAAMDVALKAFKETDKLRPIRGRRFQIIHAYLPSEENMETIKRLGITITSQPGFLYYLGDSYVENVGPDRIKKTKPHRDWFDNGINVAGSSDSPVTDFNPFPCIWSALARRTEVKNQSMGDAQKITREEAIRMYTINGAFQTFEEKVKGSLEPGKFADMIVLDRDILECPEDEIKEINVLKTFLGSEEVYSV